MIKVNLTTAKKKVDISNIGGFDFTKIKIKAVLVAIVLFYVPDFVLVPMFQQEKEDINQLITSKQQESSVLKAKMSSTKDFERQIRELEAQEGNLEQKLTAVKQAISEKRNPAALLQFISKNTPGQLWIKELDIQDETMIIKGESLSYTSIGNFVNNLRSSIFIKESGIINTSSTKGESDKTRIETFEAKFLIGRFGQ